jgi:hypothetical protein
MARIPKPSPPNVFVKGPVRIPPRFPLKACGKDELDDADFIHLLRACVVHQILRAADPEKMGRSLTFVLCASLYRVRVFCSRNALQLAATCSFKFALAPLTLGNLSRHSYGRVASMTAREL